MLLNLSIYHDDAEDLPALLTLSLKLLTLNKHHEPA
jgi:hypothetical protein